MIQKYTIKCEKNYKKHVFIRSCTSKTIPNFVLIQILNRQIMKDTINQNKIELFLESKFVQKFGVVILVLSLITFYTLSFLVLFA